MAWSDKVIETREQPKLLWEILVPTEKRVKTTAPDPATAPGDYHRWQKRHAYTTRYHRVWDEKVRAITGGLTVFTPARGQWTSDLGEVFKERMIPVRIVATRAEIDKIIDFTLEYYDQLAVFCAKVSEEVIIKHRVS